MVSNLTLPPGLNWLPSWLCWCSWCQGDSSLTVGAPEGENSDVLKCLSDVLVSNLGCQQLWTPQTLSAFLTARTLCFTRSRMCPIPPSAPIMDVLVQICRGSWTWEQQCSADFRACGSRTSWTRCSLFCRFVKFHDVTGYYLWKASTQLSGMFRQGLSTLGLNIDEMNVVLEHYPSTTLKNSRCLCMILRIS